MLAVMPNAITIDGQTMPVVGVDTAGPKLFAKTADDRLLTFPLLVSDVRRINANSVANATLAFHAVEDELAKGPDGGAEYVSYAVVDVDTVTEFLKARDYRNGWTYSGGTIAHSMPLCRVIHRDKLREARKPMLEVLDVAYQRADEQDDGPLKREIAKKKQALRDITANTLIENAADIDALKLLTVEYLLAHPAPP